MFKGCFNAVLFIIGIGILAAVFVPKMVSSPPVQTPQAAAPQQSTSPAPKQPLKQLPEPQLSAKDKAQLAKDLMANRIETAKKLEEGYLDKGMDVHVTVSGKAKDIITIRYVLMSRPMVYKIQKDGSLLLDLKNIGFRKAQFTDGYDESWTFDLTK